MIICKSKATIKNDFWRFCKDQSVSVMIRFVGFIRVDWAWGIYIFLLVLKIIFRMIGVKLFLIQRFYRLTQRNGWWRWRVHHEFEDIKELLLVNQPIFVPVKCSHGLTCLQRSNDVWNSQLHEQVIEIVGHFEFIQLLRFILIVFLEYGVNITHQHLVLKAESLFHSQFLDFNIKLSLPQYLFQWNDIAKMSFKFIIKAFLQSILLQAHHRLKYLPIQHPQLGIPSALLLFTLTIFPLVGPFFSPTIFVFFTSLVYAFPGRMAPFSSSPFPTFPPSF